MGLYGEAQREERVGGAVAECRAATRERRREAGGSDQVWDDPPAVVYARCAERSTLMRDDARYGL